MLDEVVSGLPTLITYSKPWTRGRSGNEYIGMKLWFNVKNSMLAFVCKLYGIYTSSYNPLINHCIAYGC